MEDFRVAQTGDEIQGILNQAPIDTSDIAGLKETDAALDGRLETVEGKIPDGASAENPLTDKQYVDDSIASASATFRGTYNEVEDLELTTAATHAEIAAALADTIDVADNNDYCFVQIPTDDATPTEIESIERYKFVTGTGWEYEYTLNNSGFTTAQWAAINSGITSGLVTKLTDLPTSAELTTLLNGKANAAEVYTKSETYNKTELDSMITTPDVQYVSVTATAQTTAVTDVLPATGAADTIYRVGSWDGTQYDAASYSEYAWNGSAYVPLSVKDTGIATGSDFDNPTTEQRALVTTVGSILDGMPEGVFDVSARNSGATWASLSALLSDVDIDTLIPASWRKGGMSIRFVQTSDNNSTKYVQYRLMKDEFSTTPADWQGVDDDLIVGSHNLVESGIVAKQINYLNNYVKGTVVTSETGSGTQDNALQNVDIRVGDRFAVKITAAQPITRIIISYNGTHDSSHRLYDGTSAGVSEWLDFTAEVEINTIGFHIVDSEKTASISLKRGVSLYNIEDELNANIIKDSAQDKSIAELNAVNGNAILFEQGGVDSQGLTSRTDRLRSTYIYIPFSATAQTGYQVRVWSYNYDNTVVDSGDWASSVEKSDLSKKYKILVRKTDDSTIYVSEISNIAISTTALGKYVYNGLLEKADVSYVDSGKITVRKVSSANIHNSADAETSDTQPTSGADWFGHSIAYDGTINSNPSYNLTDFIPVESGVAYKSNQDIRRLAWYDANKTFISPAVENISANTATTSPSTAKYTRFMYASSLTPDEVRFGKNSDNIDVPYVNEKQDFDPENRRIALYDDVDGLAKNNIKVLLMGSSLGVNTIIQFPFLVNACGIDIICGNMYIGSGTLVQWADKCVNGGDVNTGIYVSKEDRWRESLKTVDDVLALYDWDIIIVQRGLAESNTWTTEQSAALGTIIDHIRETVDYQPKIIFNSNAVRSVEYYNGDRQDQIDDTKAVMITARQMQEEYGIEVLPVGIAIQNARNTLLAQYGSYDGGTSEIPDLNCDITHLDIGIGSYILGVTLFEQIIAPLFNVSMIAKDYFPTAAKLATRGIWGASEYTSPSGITNYFRIANACALSAIRHPWQFDKVLPVKYPMPDTDPTQLDLDIDYTGL